MNEKKDESGPFIHHGELIRQGPDGRLIAEPVREISHWKAEFVSRWEVVTVLLVQTLAFLAGVLYLASYLTNIECFHGR